MSTHPAINLKSIGPQGLRIRAWRDHRIAIWYSDCPYSGVLAPGMLPGLPGIMMVPNPKEAKRMLDELDAKNKK